MFSGYNPNDISVLTINVTWRCPVKCSYCHITMKASLDDRGVLSRDALNRELDSARKYNITEYRFSGGDPIVIGDTLFEYADLVFDKTGQKPSLLTSGIGINDSWMRKARGKFSGIYLSVENPLEPIQTVVDNKYVLKLIGEYSCTELPFQYGLTLIEAHHFKNVVEIFEMLYENSARKVMPQLDYPCIKNYVLPTSRQLQEVYESTRTLFAKYGLIPFYFVNLVGSLAYLGDDKLRVVVNLHPDGKYDIYDTLLDAWEYSYKLKYYALKQQSQSTTCQKCEWVDSCKFHESGRIQYDWCDLRMAIFQGMYAGLNIDNALVSD